jgi:hypothetical protein
LVWYLRFLSCHDIQEHMIGNVPRGRMKGYSLSLSTGVVSPYRLESSIANHHDGVPVAVANTIYITGILCSIFFIHFIELVILVLMI